MSLQPNFNQLKGALHGNSLICLGAASEWVGMHGCGDSSSKVLVISNPSSVAKLVTL